MNSKSRLFTYDKKWQVVMANGRRSWTPVSHPSAFVKHKILWPAAVDSESCLVLQKNTHSAHWCVSHIVKLYHL